MKSREKFISDLKKELNDLEEQVKYNKFYKTKNTITKAILKTGITTIFLLPSMVSIAITCNGFKKFNLTPFKLDKVHSYAKIITTDTTTQKHNEEEVYLDGFEYSPTFEYSTGWILNKNNLFEREVSVYRLNEDIKEENIKEILKMSDEEILKLFTLTNKQTIQKAYLEEEDYFYNEDMFIITSMHEDKNKTKIVNESSDKNILSTLAYLLIGVILFSINRGILDKMRIYKKIKNSINQKYKIIEFENLEEVKEIIKIRKENIALFEEPKKYIHKNKR